VSHQTGRIAVIAVGVCLAVAAAVGCSDDSSDPAAFDPAPAGAYDASPAAMASCFDYDSWREAQDALDFDSELEAALDEDLDGVACNVLGQEEFEEAWPTGYAEACEAVFFESPDGLLYLDGVGYEQFECENTDPGPGEWDAYAYGEPEVDGAREGWITACDEFFNAYVGGELFWGDDVVVSQSDCDLANAY
jgi:hypothetical protein